MTFTADDIPYIPEGRITEKKEGGMYLILAPELPNCVSVSADGRDIINLCDGRKSIREITEEISLRKGENSDENLPKILDFINYLVNKKFAFTEPIAIEEFSPRKPESLSSIWLNVTNSCNLKCLHCHSYFGSPLENELTLDEIATVMREPSQFEGCELVISGGEPFCRYDIMEILEIASQYFGNRLILVTNGTLITDEMAKILADLHPKIQISLEGPDEESNDAVRGRGVFKKVVKAIRRLKKLGITPTVRMTLLKTNMDKLERIIEFARQERLERVTLSPLQKAGRAYEYAGDIEPTTDEFVRTFRRIKELDSDFSHIDFIEGMRPAIARNKKIDLCGAGSTMLSIGSDGGVYPCSGLMYPEFLAGNIKDSSLVDIWKNSAVFKKIRALSVSKIPGCADCPIRYICGGGCLIDIFWEHGNLHGKTPRCELLHAMAWDELKRTEYKIRSLG